VDGYGRIAFRVWIVAGAGSADAAVFDPDLVGIAAQLLDAGMHPGCPTGAQPKSRGLSASRLTVADPLAATSK
jgi:hypothetical protein